MITGTAELQRPCLLGHRVRQNSTCVEQEQDAFPPTETIEK